MENKKIDTLFQKELKSLEVSPDKKVWNSIENKLAKKKRRVFPFWWFTGSVASILVIILFFYPFFEDENQKINNNSNEIITTIPEIKPNIQDKIDSLILNNNKVEEILITKKVTPLKNYKKEEKLFIEKKESIIIPPKKRVSKILLSYHQINEKLVFINNKTTNIIQISNDNRISEKLDLNNFLPKNNPTKIKKTEIKNWSVAPVFAILKSNSFTNTSPINENLASSTKGENSYSYGVQVAYKINEKWSVQSGIHLQEMSYSNNDIAVYNSTLNSSSITHFGNGDSFTFDSNSTENLSLSSDFQSSVISPNGSLIQNYGYIEIPVEVKYNFSNNLKFESHLVTGFSSLFLNKNEVNLNTETLSKSLEVTNLNNINFSGNLGFDFNYLFNKNWSLNVNPMLKVQLNTFNKNANGFAPFNVGIYSGIKYKF